MYTTAITAFYNAISEASFPFIVYPSDHRGKIPSDATKFVTVELMLPNAERVGYGDQQEASGSLLFTSYTAVDGPHAEIEEIYTSLREVFENKDFGGVTTDFMTVQTTGQDPGNPALLGTEYRVTFKLFGA